MESYLKLPISFNLKRLEQDVAIALKMEWNAHFNLNDYDGTWKVIALRSIDGKSTSAMPIVVSGKSYQNTPVLERCHYFKSILDSFQCEIEAVRLLKLAPNSIIKEHVDVNLGYEFSEFRWHIPIQSNPQAIFYSKGEPFHMTVGNLWYLNASQPHAVENLGRNNRIHLIIDGKRNAWTDELFRKAGYDFDPDSYREERKIRQAKRKPEIEMMIAQFEHQNTPVMLELAQEWREKLEQDDY